VVGPTLQTFFVLLIIAVIISLIVSYGLKLRLGGGFVDYLAVLVASYIGAWLGPVLIGKSWFPGDAIGDVPYIPAILGSAAAYIFYVKTLAYLKGQKG